jgi:two-component system, chemotaxis family, chemotaxis protein CheY
MGFIVVTACRLEQTCPIMIAKMLIVDDHAPTREWLRSRLSPLAAEIFESSDGGEAFRVYAENKPEWILMDVEMKPMNGIAATRLIKGQFPGAKIIVVSNHNEPKIREAALEAGAYRFIPKEDLWQVRQILELEAAGEARSELSPE